MFAGEGRAMSAEQAGGCGRGGAAGLAARGVPLIGFCSRLGWLEARVGQLCGGGSA
jgi:hypothetical protein